VDREYLHLRQADLPEDSEHHVIAVASVLGQVDKKGKGVASGATVLGGKMPISLWNHSSVVKDDAPVGVAELSTSGDEVMLRGRFFDTPRGGEARQIIAALRPEWSIAFQGTKQAAEKLPGSLVTWSEIMVYEASPVIKGAVGGTGTIDVRSEQESGKEESEDPEVETMDRPYYDMYLKLLQVKMRSRQSEDR